MRDIQEPTLDDHGAEVHPAFAMIGAYHMQGGASVLFDSDILHNHKVSIRIVRASRNRDLHQDWLHGGKEIIDVEMSEAQWASFVSATNSGSGVPCTIRHIEHEEIPGLPFRPSLGLSMDEARDAAHEAFGKIKDAMAAYNAVMADKTSTVKDRREALSRLNSHISSAESNVDFAAQSLVEHSENVVQKARADVEAMVINKAYAIGMTREQIEGMAERPSVPALDKPGAQ